jgi:hypothetical protein
LPISYDLLGSPVARMELSGYCRGLPGALRPYLQFEISDLPYGVPQSRLSELVATLRPFCRGVVAHLPARIPSYGAYHCAGLTAICLSLAAAGVGETEMSSEVFKLATASTRLHLKSFVLDVPNIDALIFARDMKINMVSGPLIGAASANPGTVVRLSLREIMERSSQIASNAEIDWRQAG